MKKIRISDITMKQPSVSLSFKESIELAKSLDMLGVDVIELPGIVKEKADSLRIKSIALAVKESALAVPVALGGQDASLVWDSLSAAKEARLQVVTPVSSVQMEYLFHKKPDKMLQAITETIEACKKHTDEVEFVADDATRSDVPFLVSAINAALEAGAKYITLCDSAGEMLPNEFTAFLREVFALCPVLQETPFAVSCADALSMADSCAMAAIRYGALEVKAAAYPVSNVSLQNLTRVLAAKGEFYNAKSSVKTTSLGKMTEKIADLCKGSKKSRTSAAAEEENGFYLTRNDDADALLSAVAKLGYDLSEEEGKQVLEAFAEIAEKREKVSARELDAIVASAAMQVPATYSLEQYMITSGNTISATAHLTISAKGKAGEVISIGDGPIDAAFKAIEQFTGRHYELDDFQLQAVTEGREAMGQTVVKLRAGSKVYSGRGISTDIVGAGIYAYLNALNKIVYEEE